MSAEYGLVAPEEWLSPYERYLPDTPAWYQSAWAAWVAARLELLAGPIRGKTVEVHASRAYLHAIWPHLESLGAHLSDPLSGLTQWQRLAWYAAQPRTEPPLPSPPTLRPSNNADGVDQVVAALGDGSAAVTQEALLATGGAGLNRPGLYSWWVDRSGAADLAAGLGAAVEPGPHLRRPGRRDPLAQRPTIKQHAVD